jgi:hypothetical protein
MQTQDTLTTMEIWHKDYNLGKKDNLDELPSREAVFGVFGIVNEAPANCRWIGETDNLQETVKRLFEQPEGAGMKKFMQGPWIQMLQYELMPGTSGTAREKIVKDWTQKYAPAIDEEGEYPGYY